LPRHLPSFPTRRSSDLIMVVGGLADQLGRRPVFLGGLALFLVGSALCGLAPSVPWLIAFRVVQGLGAGAIQPTTMTISADLYTLDRKSTRLNSSHRTIS